MMIRATNLSFCPRLGSIVYFLGLFVAGQEHDTLLQSPFRCLHSHET